MTLAKMVPIATKMLFIKPDCKACGLGAACCGCYPERNYKEQYKAFVDTYGKENADAVLAYVAAKTAATNKAAELKKAEEACKQALDVCKRSGIQC